MNFQQQETEQERQARLLKQVQQQQIAEEGQREQQQRLVEQQQRTQETNAAIQRDQVLVAEINARIQAHEATINTAKIEWNTMGDSGMVSFPRFAETLNGIEDSYAPIAALRREAIGNRQGWVQGQPGYNPNAGLLALAANPTAHNPFAVLPEALNAAAALQAWANARPDVRLRQTICNHFHPAPAAVSFAYDAPAVWDRR